MAKTISERGLITTTIEASSAFSFDKRTRTIEANAYYVYCLQNSLILANQEYSRTTLILKTYNHKGASGSDSETAMRNWLRTVIPSSETDLKVLWEAYFTKYATTPDAKGATYAGLSLEAAYRKYLYVNIGLNGFFYDRVKVSDQVALGQRRRNTDTLTLSEIVSLIRGYGRSVTDTVNVVETTVLSFNKRFIDSLSVAETFTVAQTKAVSDQVVITDNATRVMAYARAISEAVSPTDTARIAFSKSFGTDAVTVVDAISKRETKVVIDSVSFADNVAYMFGYGRTAFEETVITEEIALIMTVALAENVTLNDDCVFGYNGYAADQYGRWIYGA